MSSKEVNNERSTHSQSSRSSYQPLSAHISAGISGIDLTRPLDAKQIHAIRAALLKWHVIFREQLLFSSMSRGGKGLFLWGIRLSFGRKSHFLPAIYPQSVIVGQARAKETTTATDLGKFAQGAARRLPLAVWYTERLRGR